MITLFEVDLVFKNLFLVLTPPTQIRPIVLSKKLLPKNTLLLMFIVFHRRMMMMLEKPQTTNAKIKSEQPRKKSINYKGVKVTKNLRMIKRYLRRF